MTAANDPAPVETHRLFEITQPSGEAFSVTRWPPVTLAETQVDYPGAVIEPIPDPLPAAALEGENIKIAYSLLRAWGEDDTATGLEWIDGLARDPVMLEQMHDQALTLGLARWEDAPAPAAQPEIPRQMAVCNGCGHFERDPLNPQGGLGRCLTGAPASRRAGSCWPWPDTEILCNQFEG